MPNPWPLVPLGDAASPIERPVKPLPGTVYRQVGVKLWGRGAYERERIDGAETKYKSLSRVQTGDIIVNKIWARNGSVAVIPEALAGGYVSGEFPTFVPSRGKLDARWFHWFTQTHDCWRQCDEKSQGTSGKNRIRPELFLEIKIPLPPLDEQRRIVARIEQLAAKMQEARGPRYQAVIEAEELDARATERCFTDLLSHGVLARPFQEVCDRITVGHVSSMRHAYRDVGIPFLRSQNVRNNRFEPQGLCFIAPEFHKANPKSTLQPGDVVIVRTGFVGIACVIPAKLKEANCADLVIVRPSRLLDSEYAARFLNSVSGRNRAASASVGSAQKHYNVGAMRKTQIPLPPLPEQHRVVAYLDDLQAKVDALKRLQAETAAELDALLPSILDRAFRGEL